MDIENGSKDDQSSENGELLVFTGVQCSTPLSMAVRMGSVGIQGDILEFVQHLATQRMKGSVSASATRKTNVMTRVMLLECRNVLVLYRPTVAPSESCALNCTRIPTRSFDRFSRLFNVDAVAA
ncbi:hypothetical protein EVAR_71243_1 [Eumeta japonica]|uniref:Uncharacterized protein n=1 Tax=Eumeta variegata TaxID=151549 RepID=A0A4C2A567_EUMVA|nr:hypothetical protein EVAR_71243_1 [Eumeta japonica]